MNITLTYNEGKALLDAIGGETATHLRDTRRHSWNRSHIYLLPPVGWRNVVQKMQTEGFGPRGGRAKHSESFYSALAKIVTEVKEWELHPAFVHDMVLGHDPTLVPAFDDGSGYWSPYPLSDRPEEFVVLHPVHSSRFRVRHTRWEPGPWAVSAEEPTHRHEFHCRFRVLS